LSILSLTLPFLKSEKNHKKTINKESITDIGAKVNVKWQQDFKAPDNL